MGSVILCGKQLNCLYFIYISGRYEHRNIYTYIGEVCVSMNPYRPMNIYGQEHIRKYKGESDTFARPHPQ